MVSGWRGAMCSGTGSQRPSRLRSIPLEQGEAAWHGALERAKGERCSHGRAVAQREESKNQPYEEDTCVWRWHCPMWFLNLSEGRRTSVWEEVHSGVVGLQVWTSVQGAHPTAGCQSMSREGRGAVQNAGA